MCPDGCGGRGPTCRRSYFHPRAGLIAATIAGSFLPALPGLRQLLVVGLLIAYAPWDLRSCIRHARHVGAALPLAGAYAPRRLRLADFGDFPAGTD